MLTFIATYESGEDPLAGVFPELDQLNGAVESGDITGVPKALSQLTEDSPPEALTTLSQIISTAIMHEQLELVKYTVDHQIPVDRSAVRTAVTAQSKDSLRILSAHWGIDQLLERSSTTALG